MELMAANTSLGVSKTGVKKGIYGVSASKTHGSNLQFKMGLGIFHIMSPK